MAEFILYGPEFFKFKVGHSGTHHPMYARAPTAMNTARMIPNTAPPERPLWRVGEMTTWFRAICWYVPSCEVVWHVCPANRDWSYGCSVTQAAGGQTNELPCIQWPAVRLSIFIFSFVRSELFPYHQSGFHLCSLDKRKFKVFFAPYCKYQYYQYSVKLFSTVLGLTEELTCPRVTLIIPE